MNHVAAHRKQHRHAVQIGRRTAHGHQRIHVGSAMNQAGHTANEKALIDDHYGCRQKKLIQPDRHGILPKSRRNGPSPHQRSHGHIHQGNQQD